MHHDTRSEQPALVGTDFEDHLDEEMNMTINSLFSSGTNDKLAILRGRAYYDAPTTADHAFRPDLCASSRVRCSFANCWTYMKLRIMKPKFEKRRCARLCVLRSRTIFHQRPCLRCLMNAWRMRKDDTRRLVPIFRSILYNINVIR